MSLPVLWASGAAATWEVQQLECAAGAADRCKEVPPPFHEAANWALSLVPEECDAAEGGDCPWNHMPQTWRYVWNNLRLAVKSAGPPHPDQLPEVSEDMEFQLSSVHNFMDQLDDHVGLWFRNWHEAAGPARTLAQTLDRWLNAQEARARPPFFVPAWNHGLRFPAPGRSLQLPAAGKTTPRVTLSNGVEMPLLGFGTWELGQDGTTYKAVRWALVAGYRHIDTALSFGNEREVGWAIRDSGIPRGDLFVAAKLSDPVAYAEARSVFEEQMARLGLDYVDVYMLQKPGRSREDRQAAWRALEALYDEGRIRALGVSNFGIDLMQELFDFARIRPVYVQSKYSVYQPGGTDEGRQAASLMEFLGRRGVTLVGSSTLRPGHGRLLLKPLEDPHVAGVAQRIGRSPAQVLIRWLLQLGAAVIPRSSQREHILENAQVFDFSIPEGEMRLLNGLAALVAGTPGRRVPTWCEDVYGLSRI